MVTTRERIVEEAAGQLLAHGEAAFTVASVRDALGLSSGSMFHAFESKPALVAEVFVRGMVDYQRSAMDAIAAHERPADAVRAWIDAHLRWVTEHRDLARFLFATQPDAVRDAAAEPLSEANAAFDKAVSDLFADAVGAGLVAPLPRDVVHSLVMGAAQEYCRRWTRGTLVGTPADRSTSFGDAALAAMGSTLGGERS